MTSIMTLPFTRLWIFFAAHVAMIGAALTLAGF